MRLEIFEKESPKFTTKEEVAVARIFTSFQNNEETQTVRYVLSENPEAFSDNPLVSEAMNKMENALPLLLVDNEIMMIGAYPDMEAMADLTGLTFQDLDN